MNTQQHHSKKPEVYSTSGFRDTLASPIFYPVIVVAVVLGITSIFGFVQNPLKLKTMVNVIQQKVSDVNLVSDSHDRQHYDFATPDSFTINAKRNTRTSSIHKFTDSSGNSTPTIQTIRDLDRISFDYDVTSESFWTDLDSSKLETLAEEMERKYREATILQIPAGNNLNEISPLELNVEDDSIYALNSYKKI